MYSQRTSGRFVTEDTEVLKKMRETLSEEHIKEMFEALGKLGMSGEEIVDAVASYEKKERK